MSRTSNGAAPNSPAQQQLSIQRDSGFIPLALVGFVGLAGIAAWLGQPMLCDLCIAEVFFIGNQVAKTKVSRGVASEPQSVEAGPLEVEIAEKEVQAENSAVVVRGPAHSEKAAIPETPLPAIHRTSTPPLADKATTSEVVSVDTQEVVAESPKTLEISEELVAAVTAPPEIPERVEYIVRSVPTSPASQPTNVDASIPEPPAAPLETQISEYVTPNPVPERVEYIKKPRRVSFATPPTPPVSPPRESFAIPAGLRLPPVPVPSSILTPPLSPQIHPIDYYVGIDEGIVEKDREQDEIKVLKIDDDWEYCAHELVKVEADNSSDHSLEVEEAEQKVRQPDTEEEKQLRDQIREAFEDDIPIITYIEDISEENSGQEERDEESMESSMVVVTLPEGTREEPLVSEESKPSPPDSPQLPPCTEDDEPTTISLAQQKPALIILTPETEESRVIYDATNSRLQSFDACAPTTSDAEVPGTVEEKNVDIVSVPVITDKNVATITSPPVKNSGIVFSDPFAVTPSEKIKEQESEGIEIVHPIHDIIIPSPTTVTPEHKGEVIRGPYIEPDDSDDEAPSPHAVPESEKKTSDELMDEITEILHKDNVEAKTIPDVTEETAPDVAENTAPDVAENTISDVAEKVIPEATLNVISETAPKDSSEAASKESAPASLSDIVEAVETVKTEEVDDVLSQSKILPTLVVTTPMIPEDEELIIPERKTEDVSRPPSSGSKIPSRPSTAKSSGSEAGGSSSSIDFHGQSSSLQRSASAPGSVVRTFGDPTLFSSETNANAPATPVATQIVDQEEVLPEGKEVKRLTKIDEESEDWVDVSAELEGDLKAYTVLIEEKDNHFISEDQYIGEKREQHANETTAKEKPKIAEEPPKKQPEIKALTPLESTPKRPFPTPLQLQTPPKVYNPVPESEYFRAIPRVPSLTQKPGSRRVHFNIDDMVAPDSPMFILPIPPSTYGDRPGSRDSAFSRPTSRDSAFSTLSYLDRSLDSINFPVMPKLPPLSIAPRMEPTIIVRDTMPVRGDTSEIGVETALRPLGESMKYYNSGLSDWGNSIDLERGTFHGAKPSHHDFAKDRDIAEWVNITREEAKAAAELQRNQDKGPLLPLHHSVTESEAGASSRPRRWTLLRALSIPFSAFRSSTDSPRSPTTPNSATYPQTPNSMISPRETSGFLTQYTPRSPLTPASPNYPSSSLISSDSAMSPGDPIEPIIPNPQNQPLPIRFLKKLSPKGLISGASGAARKAWGLVKYLTSPTPTHAPVPAASGVVERKQSINWLRGMDEMESGGVKMEASKGTDAIEGVLIDFGDEERRRRAREAGKRAALEGIEELREVVVVPISTV